MKHIRLLIFLLVAMTAFAGVPALHAQDTSDPDAPKLKVKVYKRWYKIVDEFGDTIRMTEMNDVVVYPPLNFKNKKQEEFYWRTVSNVRKTLPYAKAASQALMETYEYIQTIPDEKLRQKHLEQLEKEIVEQYKPAIYNMSKEQGKVLLKLINRETDQSSYQIVKAFLGSFRAAFWQAIGSFFGLNMKAGFNPAKNEDDAIIDRIATLMERGAL